MDIQNITLAGLITIGVVNVIGIFQPAIDSRIKFIISFIVAFTITFIPTEMGNIILEKAKIALEIAFASSGVYKLTQKAGGTN